MDPVSRTHSGRALHGSRRAGLLIGLVAVAVAGSAAAAPRSERLRSESAVDSARTLREAKLAARNYWRRLVPPSPLTGLSPFYDIYDHKRPFGRDAEGGLFLPAAICERQIGAFCYGPRNGNLMYNGSTSIPVAHRIADRSVMSVYRRVVPRLHRDVLRKLDQFQAAIPGDRWIMGHRVFLLLERGDLEGAAEAADRCRSDPWWCAALVGYTKSLLGRTRAADSAFAVALGTMPDSIRCRWEDLEPLFDGDDTADWYRDLDCAGKRAINPTIWWLSDPLFMEPGNDREHAHKARMVVAHLSLDAQERMDPGVFGWGGVKNSMPFGPSYQAALVRLGEPHFVAQGDGALVLQYLQPVYHFVPLAAAAREPLRAASDDWTPLDPYPAEHMMARAGRFTTLDHQVAFFRRGDSARLVAAADVAGNPVLQRAGLIGSALVLARSPNEPQRVLREPLPGTQTYVTDVAPESVLVSLEAIGAGVGAGRARFAAGPPAMPPQRITMSDILLLDSPANLPADLASAARRAAPSTRLDSGATVGLFWEVYGVAPTDSMTITLSAIEHARSGLGRLAQRLGMFAATDSLRVRWTAVSEGAIVGQSIALGLRSLGAGRYTLRIDLIVPGQRPVAVTREIAVGGR